jgi:hypothetical protein
MEERIPRKPKVKSLEKTSFNSYIPKSPFHYTIYKLKIFNNNKKRNKNYRDLLPLRRKLSGLIKRGKITYHGHNCLISSDISYLKTFFKFYKEKLLYIDNKEWRKLARVYYLIKKLTL